ncbi:DUF6265 family protein [Flavobacterium sp.]|uniref:DUF6265 family protein n=1 Tax=Flavobacterium sp. TaxID=239 RepID=UPI002613266D|nr:DUF6265 family protein [Flavobacterium sp.]MDD3003924.1 DUF6265 family protein [Flavobacterium sp.]
MKTLLKLTVLTFSVAFCFACKDKVNTKKQYPLLQKANKLLGKWENISSQGHLSENWKKINDSTFKGESYFVIEKDTVFAETIVLEERNNQLNYIVTVPNQNNAKPISFLFDKKSPKQLIFENPTHDFPNQIIYNIIRNDSLVAVIKGTKNGKDISETFKMKRIR